MSEPWLPTLAPAFDGGDPDRGESRGGVKSISDAWMTRLQRSRGVPKPLLTNVIIALTTAPEFEGVLAFDDFAQRAVALKPPPWAPSAPPRSAWMEEWDIRLAEWCQNHEISIAPLTAGQAVQAVSKDKRIHPPREYVMGLRGRWDGTRRLDVWLQDYLGAPTIGEYTSAIGSRWMIGAIARLLRPGCKLDHALVLQGAQGKKKSTALRVLSEPWFTDDMCSIDSKDAQMQVRGAWVIEWGELDSMSRVEVNKIKSFMSRQTDRYRPPYAHRLVEVPRESVFAGSTNEDVFNLDSTGGRRFWPIRVYEIDVEALARDRDQLWSEALERFEGGCPWWLDKESLEEEAKEEQAGILVPGAWDSTIEKWLADSARERVTPEDILADVIMLERAKWNQASINQVARALIRLRWRRCQIRVNGSRKWFYFHPESEVAKRFR